MFAEVVRWVHIQRTRIYTNGKYFVDPHVLIAMGRFHDMQQQRLELRVRLGAAGLFIVIECSWMYLTSLVTTRIDVKLAAV